VTIETPTEIIVSSKSINMPIFGIRKTEGAEPLSNEDIDQLISEAVTSGAEEAEPSVTVEPAPEIMVGSESINMPVFRVKSAENIIPKEEGEAEEQPVIETEALQELIEEAKEAGTGS